MTRSLTALLLTASALVALTGCESMQLPDGYAWNLTPHQQNNIKSPRGSFRWGFDQSRIGESRPTTAHDAGRYDFAAALPATTAPPAPALTRAADYSMLDDVPASVRPLGYGNNDPVFATAPAPGTPGSSASATEPVAFGRLSAPAEVRILTTPSTSPAAPRAAVSNTAGQRTHVIQKGDSYWKLAKQYYGKGIRFTDIQKANPSKNPKKLQVGDTIIIPQ